MSEIENYYRNLLKNSSKTLWIEKCLDLPIFSKNQKVKRLSEYYYVESTCEVFYIRSLRLFVDENKKIILFSNWKIQNDHYFLMHIEQITKGLEQVDLKTAEPIESSLVTCEKWFISYGHFSDEMFNIYDFKMKSKSAFEEYTTLTDYPPSQEKYPAYRIPKDNHNYTTLCKLLFNDNYINADTLDNNIYKLKKIVVISNAYNDPTFHKFPKSARNHIIEQITDNSVTNPNLFLTRSSGLHCKRILDNMSDIEDYFKQKKYNVINPENINYLDLVRNIINVKNLVLTWGGALVLLMYVNKNSNITILKGKSYSHEPISMIKNLIKNYSLVNIKIIDVPNNILDFKLIENL